MNNENRIENQQTYTAHEIADILSVSIRTAYNLCNTTKDFKVIRIGKKCLRIHKKSFDEWLNRNLEI